MYGVMILNVHQEHDIRTKNDNTTKKIKFPMKICTYSNYCMFENTGQEPDKNIQLLEYPIVQTFKSDSLRIKSKIRKTC